MVGLVNLKQYSKKMLHCTLWLDIVIDAVSEVQLWFFGQELKRLAVKFSKGQGYVQCGLCMYSLMMFC